MVDQWAGELDDQDDGKKHRGRKLSDSGAKARFYHAVCEAHLSRIIQVDMAAQQFSYDIDESARTLAEKMDGKLLLVSNVQDLSPAEVVTRYKSLADIKRGFKVLKSELEIGPVYHRLPDRIRAHAAICFMALILHRVMRSRLRASHTGLTPERALEQLRRIQHHQIRLNGAPPVSGVVFHPRVSKRGSECPPGKKTSCVSATDAVVVERFEIAISNIKELQD